MNSLRQFMLSLVATTISIVLTFGTAAWVDSRKKAADKREMVMMILYDLNRSLEDIQKNDSTLREGVKAQLTVVEKPEQLAQNPFFFVKYVVTFNYTETVERIFSSNIETINTIGNVFFAENVSDLYQMRKEYKEEIIDKYMEEYTATNGFNTYEAAINAQIPLYSCLSSQKLNHMKEIFEQCKKMMNVTDADLAAYKDNLDEIFHSQTDSLNDALTDELIMNMNKLKEFKDKRAKQ